MNFVLWQNKKRIYNAILRPVLTYGAEVWQLSKKQKNSLLAVEMDFWRRAAGRSRMEHTRNEEIRRQMNVERTLVEDIEKQQLVWYGHVRRMRDQWLPKIVLE